MINAFLMVFAGSLLANAQPTPAKAPVQAASTQNFDEANLSLETSINLRDPFSRVANRGMVENNEDKIPELERYELDKFSLVGIITGPKKSKALLVADETKKLHVVSEKARIGTRGGYVKSIEPGMVTIEEKVVNLLGQEESIETVLELKKSDEKK
jgi:Tfp pilus assembly protein PilP